MEPVWYPWPWPWLCRTLSRTWARKGTAACACSRGGVPVVGWSSAESAPFRQRGPGPSGGVRSAKNEPDHRRWGPGPGNKMLADGQDRMTQESWGRVRHDLERSLGQNNFSHWIAPLKLRGINGRRACSASLPPSTAIGSTGTTATASSACCAIRAWRCHGWNSSSNRPNPNRRRPRRCRPIRSVPATHLSARRWIRASRFDSFVVGKPNELAHAAARRVAEGGPVTFNRRCSSMAASASARPT